MTLEDAQELAKVVKEYCKGRIWFRSTATTMQQDRSYAVAINIRGWETITIEEQFSVFDHFKGLPLAFRVVTEPAAKPVARAKSEPESESEPIQEPTVKVA